MAGTKLERLAETKQALADKFDRLALLAGSTPKRRTLVYHAERFRRQAQEIRRRCES